MRVCFVSLEYPPNVIGGAGTYAGALVNGLQNRGLEIFTITRGDRNDYRQQIYRVQTPDNSYWRRLFFIKTAMSLFHKLNVTRKFDIVHLNEPHIVFRKPEVPTVCTFHSIQANELRVKLVHSKVLVTRKDITDLVLKSPIGSICDLITTRAADRIICPSPHLASLIMSNCRVDGNKVRVVPNGIDFEALDRTKAYDDDFLRKYGLEKDNYLLFIGRLSALKGIQFLIQAFRLIKKDYANLKLAIVGTGEFETYLRDLARGIENIVFTGYVSSVRIRKMLYENSLLVVVPSLYETFPMVLLEAMAFGKAVVASSVGGIPLLVKNGKSGFLAKPGDPEDIRRLITVLYEDRKLRECMGSSGRELAQKEFSVDRMVDRTLTVYDSLL
jgi:glycosyltransferase involved in cell wall biosynthesis